MIQARSIARRWRGRRLFLLLLFCLSVSVIGNPILSRATVVPLAITDEDITIAIESRFLVDKSVEANFIDVDTKNGIVTLSGSIDNLLAKERAGKIVESVRGVKALINAIQVRPLHQPDDETLQRRVIAALADDPAADSYEIVVDVDDGTVILHGTVQSWQEKFLSEEVAKSVSGVRDLTSQIIAKPATNRDDSEIEADIVRHLQSDVWVDEGLIGIMVEQGRVTLTGTVGSLAEKQAAFGDAWVSGVTEVSVDRLKVEWWARDRMLKDPANAIVSTTEKEAAVRIALSYDPRLQKSDISVRVMDGTAILGGLVNNLATKQAAENTARSTVGIWQVRNLIKVRPNSPYNDEELEERVLHVLNHHPMIDRYDIKVSSRSGRISLEGYVQSSTEISQAVRTVARVKGVTDIVNYLKIASPSNEKYDEEIWEEIRRSFWWDPRLYDMDITVTVDNGVTTLRGTVPSILEWRRANSIAKEAGSSRVRNRLKVTYGPDFLSA
ncbi:MAG: BON domain-containing protein [Nitrospirales bacterium]